MKNTVTDVETTRGLNHLLCKTQDTCSLREPSSRTASVACSYNLSDNLQRKRANRPLVCDKACNLLMDFSSCFGHYVDSSLLLVADC